MLKRKLSDGLKKTRETTVCFLFPTDSQRWFRIILTTDTMTVTTMTKVSSPNLNQVIILIQTMTFS